MATNTHSIARTKISQLSLEEQARGFSHKFTIDYTDVNTGTTATDVETMAFGTTPAKYVIDKCLVNVRTAFAGTGAFTLTVGTTTTTNAFVTSQSVLTAGVLTPTTGGATITTGTAAIGLLATFTNATSGSPSALTAGSLDIYLNIIDLNQATPGLG